MLGVGVNVAPENEAFADGILILFSPSAEFEEVNDRERNVVERLAICYGERRGELM